MSSSAYAVRAFRIRAIGAKGGVAISARAAAIADGTTMWSESLSSSGQRDSALPSGVTRLMCHPSSGPPLRRRRATRARPSEPSAVGRVAPAVVPVPVPLLVSGPAPAPIGATC